MIKQFDKEIDYGTWTRYRFYLRKKNIELRPKKANRDKNSEIIVLLNDIHKYV